MPVSWSRLEEICFQLAQKIIKKKLVFDRIICISRGGLVASRIFSDFLNLPVSNFTIVSYVKVGQPGKPKIVENLSIDIKNEKVLLVDEIVDHGSTLKKAVRYLDGFSPQKVTTLALFVKPWSQPKPDLWQVKTSKWVVFPYEVRETIENLVVVWRKQRHSGEEMKERFDKLGFPQKEVDSFLKIKLG